MISHRHVSANARRTISGIAMILAGTLAGALAGCGANSGGSGSASATGGSTDCRAMQASLRRLDARGVPAKVEAANNGKRLSASARADVKQYNALLNRYIGRKCHK